MGSPDGPAREAGPRGHNMRTLLAVLLVEVVAGVIESPSRCVLTIISCCNPGQPPGQHPFRCFEVNECPGLYWEGRDACSDKTVARAIQALGELESEAEAIEELELEAEDLEELKLEAEGAQLIETRVNFVRENEVEIDFVPVRRKRPNGQKKRRRKNKFGRGGRLSNGSVLPPFQSIRPAFHPASSRHYLTISPLGGGAGGGVSSKIAERS